MSLEFSGLTMPLSPVHVNVPPTDDSGTSYPTYNVLLSSVMDGTSMKKLTDSVAIDLSKTKWPQAPHTNMFNVSVLSWGEQRKLKQKESATLHVLQFSKEEFELIKPGGPNFPELIRLENNLVETILRNGDPEFVK